MNFSHPLLVLEDPLPLPELLELAETIRYMITARIIIGIENSMSGATNKAKSISIGVPIITSSVCGSKFHKNYSGN